jgi:hypothetical protein
VSVGGSLRGPFGIGLAAAWGFAEGTLFFVVPDVLFTRVAIAEPRRALAHLAAATAGAVAAGALMFAWASADPDGARSAVAAVPKVGAGMVEATRERLAASGAAALFDRPLGGVPYKVHAVLAPERFGLVAFLGLSVLARLERFLLSWTAFAVLHRAFVRPRRASARTAAWIHAAFWLAVYAVYWAVL